MQTRRVIGWHRVKSLGSSHPRVGVAVPYTRALPCSAANYCLSNEYWSLPFVSCDNISPRLQFSMAELVLRQHTLSSPMKKKLCHTMKPSFLSSITYFTYINMHCSLKPTNERTDQPHRSVKHRDTHVVRKKPVHYLHMTVLRVDDRAPMLLLFFWTEAIGFRSYFEAAQVFSPPVLLFTFHSKSMQDFRPFASSHVRFHNSWSTFPMPFVMSPSIT